jgi:hypothetical protein
MDIKEMCLKYGISLEEIGDIGKVSDGYHTFDSLYYQRCILFATLCNTFKDLAWKSHKHSEGEECFGGGWFIVGIDTPEGTYTYHYENKYWDLFKCHELDVAPEWDGHTEEDVTRIMSLWGILYEGNIPEEAPNCEHKICYDPESIETITHHKVRRGLHNIFDFIKGVIKGTIDFFKLFVIFRKKSNMLSWAEREIKIACKSERAGNGDPTGKKWDYGCACYESALRAFNSLTKDGHSGFSIGLTKNILVRLIEDKPLTPIDDTEDVWSDILDRSGLRGEEVSYQCRRMGSLFKYVYADGTVKYRDVDSYYCVDAHTKSTYHNGFIGNIINEMFPITMPYMPGKPIKVYCEECLTDRKNGDFDTMGILYIMKPTEDLVDEKIEINKFFKESKGTPRWVEISREEYDERWARKI